MMGMEWCIMANNYYLGFDGVTGYVDAGQVCGTTFGDPVVIADGDGIAITCWGLSTQTGGLFCIQTGVQTYLDCTEDNLDSFAVSLRQTNQNAIGFSTGSTTGPGNYDDDLWHLHVLVITKIDAGNASLKLYNNGGIVISTGAFSLDLVNFLQTFVDNGSSVKIGTDAYGFTWGGYIDDFRIYNSSLTQEQITALYNKGRGTKYPDAGPTAAYALNMDEGTGTTVTDAVSGTLQGTLVGGVGWQTGGVPFCRSGRGNPKFGGTDRLLGHPNKN